MTDESPNLDPDLPAPWVEAMLRTPRHPLRKHLPHIERMAAQGMEPPQIAARLNVPLAVLEAAALEFEDVRVAFTGGRARGVDTASRAILKASERGDVGAAKFLLQSKGGFAPTSRQEAPPPLASSGPAPIDMGDITRRLDDQRNR